MTDQRSMAFSQPGTKSMDWITPPDIVKACGEFDLDPCGNALNIKNPAFRTAKAIWLRNGLEREWKGRVWLNPPYGRDIKAWMKKLSEYNWGMAFVFARPDTNWFQQYVFKKACAIYFLAGRVNFYLPTGIQAKNSGGCGSCLIAYGLTEMNDRLRKIDKAKLLKGYLVELR